MEKKKIENKMLHRIDNKQIEWQRKVIREEYITEHEVREKMKRVIEKL